MCVCVCVCVCVCDIRKIDGKKEETRKRGRRRSDRNSKPLGGRGGGDKN